MLWQSSILLSLAALASPSLCVAQTVHAKAAVRILSGNDSAISLTAASVKEMHSRRLDRADRQLTRHEVQNVADTSGQKDRQGYELILLEQL